MFRWISISFILWFFPPLNKIVKAICQLKHRSCFLNTSTLLINHWSPLVSHKFVKPNKLLFHSSIWLCVKWVWYYYSLRDSLKILHKHLNSETFLKLLASLSPYVFRTKNLVLFFFFFLTNYTMHNVERRKIPFSMKFWKCYRKEDIKVGMRNLCRKSWMKRGSNTIYWQLLILPLKFISSLGEDIII